MAFCTHCGTQINDGARFCQNCGSALNPQTNATVSNTGKQVSKKGLLFAVCGVLTIVLIVVILSVSLRNNSGYNRSTPEETINSYFDALQNENSTDEFLQFFIPQTILKNHPDAIEYAKEVGMISKISMEESRRQTYGTIRSIDYEIYSINEFTPDELARYNRRELDDLGLKATEGCEIVINGEIVGSKHTKTMEKEVLVALKVDGEWVFYLGRGDFDLWECIAHYLNDED